MSRQQDSRTYFQEALAKNSMGQHIYDVDGRAVITESSLTHLWEVADKHGDIEEKVIGDDVILHLTAMGGAEISRCCDLACRIAKAKPCDVDFMFNGQVVVVTPGMTKDEVYVAWNKEQERRTEEYRKTDKYKEAQALREAEVTRLTTELKALMLDFNALDFTDLPKVAKWLTRFTEVGDHIDVKTDTWQISAVLEKHGLTDKCELKEDDETTEEWKARTSPDEKWRRLIAQAIGTMRMAGIPHPMYIGIHKEMAEELGTT